MNKFVLACEVAHGDCIGFMHTPEVCYIPGYILCINKGMKLYVLACIGYIY